MSVLNANPAHQRTAGRNAGSPEISAWPSAKRSPGAGGSIVGTAASTTAASEDLILAKQTTEFATTAAPEQTPTSVPSVPSAPALTLAVIPTPALTLRTHYSSSHYNRSRSPVPCPGWSDEALTLIRYRLQRLQDSHGGSRRQGSRATAPRVHRPARQHVKSAVLVPSDSVSVHK